MRNDRANIAKSISVVISIILPVHTSAESYGIPEEFVVACILRNQLEDIPRTPVSTFVDIMEYLANSDATSTDCLTAIENAEIALERYYFRKDLDACSDGAIEPGVFSWIPQADEFPGMDYCSSLRIEDWRSFSAWKNSEEGRAAIDAVPDISDLPIFAPLEIISFDPHAISEEKDSDAYVACSERASQEDAAALRICVIEETQRQDVILNAAFGCLKQELPAEEFQQLRNRQRQWIKDTNRDCAFENEEGTIVADFRAGCRHDATKEKAQELAVQARAAGCNIPSVDEVRYDLDNWHNIDGTATTSNREGWAAAIDCFGDGIFRLTPDNPSKVDNVYLGDPLDLYFYDANDNPVASLEAWAVLSDGTIHLSTDDFMYQNLRTAAAVSIEDGNYGIHLSLRGSSAALEGCKASGGELTTNAYGKSTPLDVSGGSFITLAERIPVYIRCDTPFPEFYFEYGPIFDDVFGQPMRSGDRFSFELYNRSGDRTFNITSTAIQLSGGIGIPINLSMLFNAQRYSTVAVVSGGKEYTFYVSPYKNEFARCQDINHPIMHDHLVGKWYWGGSGEESMTFTNQPIGTVSGTLERLFYNNERAGENSEHSWFLRNDGTLYIDQNMNICEVEPYVGGMRVKNAFMGCGVQGVWLKE